MKRIAVVSALLISVFLITAQPIAAADAPTVLVPRGVWINMPRTTGAVKCASNNRPSLCVDSILINGQEATLVEGYTGSCITMAIANSPNTIGCSKSTDLNGNTQLTDLSFWVALEYTTYFK